MFSAFAGLGYVGPGAVAQLGAIVQMARQATGSSEQATTATEALLRTLSDAAKLDKIESELGVQVRRDDGSYRDLDKILTELISAVDGDIVQLSEIFDAEALRVFNALVRKAGVSDEFTSGDAAQRSGLEDYQRYLETEAEGDELTKDAARIANTTEAAAQDIRTSFEAKLTEYFTGPLKGVATTLAEFQGEIVAAAGAGDRAQRGLQGGQGRGVAALWVGAKDAGEAAEAVGDAGFDADRGETGGRKGAQKGKSGRLGPKVGRMQVGTLVARRMIGAKAGAGSGTRTLAAGATGAGVARSAGTVAKAGAGRGLMKVAGKALKAIPLVGTGILVGEIALDLAGVDLGEVVDGLLDRRESATPASGVLNPRAYSSPVRREELGSRPVGDLEPAPIAAPVKTRASLGNVRYRSQVRINVQSNAADPEVVAEMVAEKVERIQRDERVRLEGLVFGDDSTEVQY